MNQYNDKDVDRPTDFGLTAHERTQLQARKDFSVAGDEGYVYAQDDAASDADQPVLVSIVGPLPEPQITDWSSLRMFVDASRPVQIAGARRNRVRLLIWKDAGDTVDIRLLRSPTDHIDGAAEFSGTQYVLEMKHNEEVWAITTTGSLYVNVMQEYIVEGTDRPINAK